MRKIRKSSTGTAAVPQMMRLKKFSSADVRTPLQAGTIGRLVMRTVARYEL